MSRNKRNCSWQVDSRASGSPLMPVSGGPSTPPPQIHAYFICRGFNTKHRWGSAAFDLCGACSHLYTSKSLHNLSCLSRTCLSFLTHFVSANNGAPSSRSEIRCQPFPNNCQSISTFHEMSLFFPSLRPVLIASLHLFLL